MGERRARILVRRSGIDDFLQAARSDVERRGRRFSSMAFGLLKVLMAQWQSPPISVIDSAAHAETHCYVVFKTALTASRTV
jgi:hypothetical protein